MERGINMKENKTNIFKNHHEELLKLYVLIKDQYGTYSKDYLLEKLGGMLVDIPLCLHGPLVRSLEIAREDVQDARDHYGIDRLKGEEE